MITTTMMYWIIKLDSIIGFFDVLQFLSGALIVACIIGMGIIAIGASGVKYPKGEEIQEFKDHTKKGWSICKKFIATLIICSFIKSFLPTTKEMAVIYVVPKIANSEFVNETLPNELKDIYIMAKDWMRETLKTNMEEPKKVEKVEKVGKE